MTTAAVSAGTFVWATFACSLRTCQTTLLPAMSNFALNLNII